MTTGLTRMLALKGAQLTPLLSVMYRNVETRKEFGLKEFGEPPHPKGSRARAQRLFPYPCGAEPAEPRLCSQSHRHHLLLNCTFTFTQTISKSWKKCRVRGREGQVPLRSHDPSGLPQVGQGGSIRLSVSGHQLSMGTRTASQQLLTHKYRHA